MSPTERVASRLVTWLLEGREKVVVRPRDWLVKELPRGWLVKELAPLPKQRCLLLLNPKSSMLCFIFSA